MDEKVLVAKRKALKLLARKRVLTSELVELLTAEELPQSLIDEMVEEWQRFGYLDDDDWIKSRIASHKSHKKGPRAISYALKEKNVPAEIIVSKLQEHYSDEEQQEALSAFIKKKKGALTMPLDGKKRAKIINACLRQGFHLDIILTMLEQECR